MKTRLAVDGHRKKAAGYGRRAKGAARRALRLAEAGACTSAMSELSDAAYLNGLYEGHRESATGKIGSPVTRIITRAREAFVRACLIGARR